MSDESTTAKGYNMILEDIKNNRKITKHISIKSHGININLRPLINKLLNTEKMVLRKDYGFDETFNIFDEIDNMRNRLYAYKPKASNTINTNNKLLEYLKIMEGKLTEMFSSPDIIRKINIANCEGHIKEKLEMGLKKYPDHAKKILGSIKLKMSEKATTEVPKGTITEKVLLEGDEELVDILTIPPLEADEEVKEGKGIKILILSKLLTKLPVLLAQIKPGNNSNELKNVIIQIVYLLYQQNKIIIKFYNNLIKSL